MSDEWDAATYDQIADPMTEWGRIVVERFSPPPRALVLDAGCGSGRVTEILLQRRPDIRLVALDGSAAMIDEARRRLSPYADRVEFAVADLSEPLPIPPVGGVLSTATFHWIHDHDAFFQHLAAVTLPGSPLCAQWGALGNLARIADRLLERGIDYHREVHFVHAHDTRRSLDAAGWDVRDVWVHEQPIVMPNDEALDRYLRTVILRPLVDRLGPDEADDLIAFVMGALPDRVLDYVRMDADATRR